MSIFDLVPPSEIVEIGEEKQEIRAIGLADALQIIARFPALSAFLTGGKKQISFAELIGTGAVPAIIAAGCGRPGDSEAETRAATLDADAQGRLITPIIRLTMPRGAIPFLTTVTEFLVALSPSPPPTREEIAQRTLAKHLRTPSQGSSSNTEVPSAAIAS